MKNYFQKNYSSFLLNRLKNSTYKLGRLLTFNIMFLINWAQAQTAYQPFFKDSTLLYKAQNIDFIGSADQYQKSFYKAAAFDSIVNINGLAFYYPFKTAHDTSNQPQGGNSYRCEWASGWVIIFIMMHKCIINL